MVEPIAEPSKDLTDVTRVPLSTLRSSNLARSIATDTTTLDLKTEQFDVDFTDNG